MKGSKYLACSHCPKKDVPSKKNSNSPERQGAGVITATFVSTAADEYCLCPQVESCDDFNKLTVGLN